VLVLEFKTYGKLNQFNAIDDAIRTTQFIRNKCIRLWMDEKGTGKNDLQKYCAVLAKEFPFADELNSMARQASAERALAAIANRRRPPVLLASGHRFTALSRTARKEFPVKKDSPNSRKTVALSSTKRLDGS
jgi:transposase